MLRQSSHPRRRAGNTLRAVQRPPGPGPGPRVARPGGTGSITDSPRGITECHVTESLPVSADFRTPSPAFFKFISDGPVD
jgi:hypothetical protein